MYDLEWRSVVICGALWRGAAGYVALWRSLDGYRVLWRNVANCGALRHNQISTCLCASKRCAPVAAEVAQVNKGEAVATLQCGHLGRPHLIGGAWAICAAKWCAGSHAFSSYGCYVYLDGLYECMTGYLYQFHFNLHI